MPDGSRGAIDQLLPGGLDRRGDDIRSGVVPRSVTQTVDPDEQPVIELDIDLYCLVGR